MKNKLKFLVFLFIILINSMQSFAHCEIPCGIYDDQLRINLIKEHIKTIEKSIEQINYLTSIEENKNYNQIVRWINNKEEHANKIQEITSQYFLNQRIKITSPTDGEKLYLDYLKKLEYLHQISVYAMLNKQNSDLLYVEKLKNSLDAFEHLYLDEKHKN